MSDDYDDYDDDDDELSFFDSGDSDGGDITKPSIEEERFSLNDVHFRYSDDDSEAEEENPNKGKKGGKTQIDQKVPKPRDPFDLSSDEEMNESQIGEYYGLLKDKFKKLLSTYNNYKLEIEEYTMRIDEIKEKRGNFQEEIETLGEMRISLQAKHDVSKDEILKSVVRKKTGQKYVFPKVKSSKMKSFDERMEEIEFNRRNRELTSVHSRLVTDYTNVQNSVNKKVTIFRAKLKEEILKKEDISCRVEVMKEIDERKTRELYNLESELSALEEGIGLLEQQIHESGGEIEEEKENEEKEKSEFEVYIETRKRDEIRRNLELELMKESVSFEKDNCRKVLKKLAEIQEKEIERLRKRERDIENNCRKRRLRRVLGIGRIFELGKLDFEKKSDLKEEEEEEEEEEENTNNNKEEEKKKYDSTSYSEIFEGVVKDYENLKKINGDSFVKDIEAVGISIKEKISVLRGSVRST